VLIKVTWILIGMNAIALMVFVGWFLASSVGRNVDTMEKGWMFILFGLGITVILLAAVPLWMSQSAFSVFFSGFFAALPLVVALGVLISKNLPSFRKDKSMAKTYYQDKTQQSIASAIEQNDTLLLSELIKGQDLNVKGARVWDRDGINYLQFTIMLRSMTDVVPVNIAANTAAIRMLVTHGSSTTPALCDAVRYVPLEILSLLLDAGGDPNRRSDVTDGPILFDAIGTEKQQNDKAILLIRKGANVNATNGYGFTPVMAAAINAQTSANWNDVWRVVRYLLENANCDYAYTTRDGNSFQKVIQAIRTDAHATGKTMPSDFIKVVEWLKHHGIETDPINEK
jgi:ankyrin repeat protein